MWIVYALLSALFASLTAILAKIGVKDIDSDLATAIRTAVIVVLAWAIVFAKGAGKGITHISKHTLLFLVLSGCATGLSWLFYFKAIKLGEVSRVAPIDKLSVALTIVLSVVLLGEHVTAKELVGVGLILGGTLVLVLA
jgi:transporter family protein